MRVRFFGSVATAFACVVASCAFPSNTDTSACAKDAEACPESSKVATTVTCDCKCTIGLSDELGDTYEGSLSLCLPAPLNPTTASSAQLQTLASLASHDYDQQVFKFCSERVASFLNAAIKTPVGQVRACAVPVDCQCTTKGAKDDSMACHAQCAEIDCDQHNCPYVLRHGSKVDMGRCFCSRARSCGTVMPREDEPALCRDWAHPKDAGADSATSHD